MRVDISVRVVMVYDQHCIVFFANVIVFSQRKPIYLPGLSTFFNVISLLLFILQLKKKYHHVTHLIRKCVTHNSILQYFKIIIIITIYRITCFYHAHLTVEIKERERERERERELYHYILRANHSSF